MLTTSKQIEAFTFQVSYYHNQESNHLLFIAEVLTTAFKAALEKSHWPSSPKHLATRWWHSKALSGAAGSLCCGSSVWPPPPHLGQSTSAAQAPLFYSFSPEATAQSGARSVITSAWGSSLSHAELRAGSLLFAFPFPFFWFFLRLSFWSIDHLLPITFLEGKCVPEDIPPLQTQEEKV